MKARKVFKELVPVDVAFERLLKAVPPKPPKEEVLKIEDSLNYYLAEDIEAKINLPPYPRTSVDGYAVNSRSTWGAYEDNPVELKVIGRVPVGEKPKVKVGLGEAVEVDTGSALPEGADAVIMIEYTKEVGDDRILVFKSVVPGENVLWPATDVYKGQPLFKKGTRITSRVIASLAAVGIREVKVWRPRVYLISTGNELVEPGKPLEVGKIYDINTYSLAARLREEGFLPIVHGVVRDDEEEIEKAILKGIEVADVVVTTGSTSAGPEDKVYRVVGKLGQVLVHGLAFKPGKPVMLGVVKGKPVFGLAGHPDSAYFNLERIVIPYLRMMVAAPSEPRRKLKAIALSKFVGAKGRRTHIPVKLLTDNKAWYAFPTAISDHAMVSYSKADGYIIIPETRRAPVDIGESVEVYLFKDPSYEFAVVGDTDEPVDKALKAFSKEVKDVLLGSYIGQEASQRSIKSVWIAPNSRGEEVKVQAVVVGKGERLGIPHKTSFLYEAYLKWLKDKGLSKAEASKKYMVIPFPSPQAIASALKEGLIDVGITTRASAEAYGLDWEPLAELSVNVGWTEEQRELGELVLDELRRGSRG